MLTNHNKNCELDGIINKCAIPICLDMANLLVRAAVVNVRLTTCGLYDRFQFM